MNPVEFELWEENGRCYVQEFLDEIGDVLATKFLDKLEDYGKFSVVHLVWDGKIREVLDRPDLYYVRVNVADVRIRFLATARGNTMWLVHGVKKQRFRAIAESHFDTGQERASKIP